MKDKNRKLKLKHRLLYISALRGRAGVYHHLGDYNGSERDYLDLLGFLINSDNLPGEYLLRVKVDYANLLSIGKNEWQAEIQ